MSKERSGPRKSRENEKRQIATYAGEAIRTIATIMRDEEANSTSRLNAAQYLLDQFMGKPAQSHELIGAEEAIQITVQHSYKEGGSDALPEYREVKAIEQGEGETLPGSFEE